MVASRTYIETVAASPVLYLVRVLRNRTPSSPIYLSEVIRKPLALSRAFLLSSGGKSIVLVKKKRLPAVAFPHLYT